MSDPTSVQKLIQDVEQADSPERLMLAVQVLAAARSVAGIPTLIQALGFNNPGAAAVAVQGLVQMGSVAVQPLLEQLDDYNYGARAWAIRALVALADPQALDVLLTAAAADFAPSVRRAATKGLGTLQWQLLSGRDLIAAQGRVLETLLTITEDPDWSLRYAATVGLESLGRATQPDLRTQILIRLQQMVETESDLAVQARVRRATTILTNPSIASMRSTSLSTVTH